jgi:Cd2+/Zn2+-exporting ATPase
MFTGDSRAAGEKTGRLLGLNSVFAELLPHQKVEKFKEYPGQGIYAVVGGKEIYAGNSSLLDYAGINYTKPEDQTGTVVYIASDGAFAGYIIISDEIKPDSKAAIKRLKSAGIKKIAMFTGDSRFAGEKIGRMIGLSSVFAELLPHQKVEKFKEVKEKEKNKSGKNNIIFVGDGINDAPILAAADIGIAMGGLGSDAAIEAADIVLMTDEPSKIADAIQIARKTKNIVMQNIIFALGVKVIILILGALGIATMWGAVFGDVGVSFIAILNAMRAMKFKRVD